MKLRIEIDLAAESFSGNLAGNVKYVLDGLLAEDIKRLLRDRGRPGNEHKLKGLDGKPVGVVTIRLPHETA